MTDFKAGDRPAIVDELKAGLEGVTGGANASWVWQPFADRIAMEGTTCDGRKGVIVQHINLAFKSSDERDANARHIARCSPHNIAAVLAYIKTVEAERDEYKAKWSSWEEGDPEGVFAHMDAFKARAEAAEAKVAELTEALRKAENGNFEQDFHRYP